MPTTTTKATGGKALVMTPMSVTAPEQHMPPEVLDGFASGMGLNGLFLADLLSSFLAHEQSGYHLYQAAAGLTKNRDLKATYEEFGRETENHIRILEDLIRRLGGDPGYVSASARLVEATGAKLLDAASLLAGTADEGTIELSVLEAVVLAETKDHADWRLLASLTKELPEGDLKGAFRSAVEQVEAEEDKHLSWASSTWETMIMTKAKSGSA